MLYTQLETTLWQVEIDFFSHPLVSLPFVPTRSTHSRIAKSRKIARAFGQLRRTSSKLRDSDVT